MGGKQTEKREGMEGDQEKHQSEEIERERRRHERTRAGD